MPDVQFTTAQLAALALLIFITALQIADVFTTYVRIRAGVAREGNPLVAWLIAKLGLGAGLSAAKLPVAAGIAYWVWLALAVPASLSAIVLGAMAAVAVFYGWVVWSNTRIAVPYQI